MSIKINIPRIRLPSSCRKLVPRCRSLMATSAQPLAAKADLWRAIWPLSVPQEGLDMEKAAARLQKQGLRLPVAGGKLWEFNPVHRILFWEVYSGCGNATRAFVESASRDHKIG